MRNSLEQEIAWEEEQKDSCYGEIKDIRKRIEQLEYLKSKIVESIEELLSFQEKRVCETDDMLDMLNNLKSVILCGEHRNDFLNGNQFQNCRRRCEEIIREIDDKIWRYENDICSLNSQIASIEANIEDLFRQLTRMESR